MTLSTLPLNVQWTFLLEADAVLSFSIIKSIYYYIEITLINNNNIVPFPSDIERGLFHTKLLTGTILTLPNIHNDVSIRHLQGGFCQTN